MRIRTVELDEFQSKFDTEKDTLPNEWNYKYYIVEEAIGYAVNIQTGEVLPYNEDDLDLDDDDYMLLMSAMTTRSQTDFINGSEESKYYTSTEEVFAKQMQELKKAKKYHKLFAVIPILIFLLSIGIMLYIQN